MRLLIITQKVDKNDSNLGFFHRWLINFAQNVEQLTVIGLETGEYDLPENVRVFSLGKEEGVCRLKYIYRLFLYSIRERKEYDAVFVHMNPIYIATAGWLWVLLGKRIGLWYVHGARPLSLRVANHFVQAIMTASEKSLTLVTKKKRVIGHGIDTNFFSLRDLDRESHVPKMITFGRMSPVKDHWTLLNALVILRDKGRKFSCDIIGAPVLEEEKSYCAELERFVADNNLTEQVNFKGALPHDELVPHLRDADIFVHMSNHGGLDKASLEAMSLGLPIVSCNETLQEPFGPYVDELFYKQGDAEAFAKKISGVMDMSSDELRGLALYLRKEVVDGHSLDALVLKIIRLLESTKRTSAM